MCLLVGGSSALLQEHIQRRGTEELNMVTREYGKTAADRQRE